MLFSGTRCRSFKPLPSRDPRRVAPLSPPASRSTKALRRLVAAPLYSPPLLPPLSFSPPSAASCLVPIPLLLPSDSAPVQARLLPLPYLITFVPFAPCPLRDRTSPSSSRQPEAPGWSRLSRWSPSLSFSGQTSPQGSCNRGGASTHSDTHTHTSLHLLAHIPAHLLRRGCWKLAPRAHSCNRKRCALVLSRRRGRPGVTRSFLCLCFDDMSAPRRTADSSGRIRFQPADCVLSDPGVLREAEPLLRQVRSGSP